MSNIITSITIRNLANFNNTCAKMVQTTWKSKQLLKCCTHQNNRGDAIRKNNQKHQEKLEHETAKARATKKRKLISKKHRSRVQATFRLVGPEAARGLWPGHCWSRAFARLAAREQWGQLQGPTWCLPDITTRYPCRVTFVIYLAYLDNYIVWTYVWTLRDCLWDKIQKETTHTYWCFHYWCFHGNSPWINNKARWTLWIGGQQQPVLVLVLIACNQSNRVRVWPKKRLRPKKGTAFHNMPAQM